ncbi:MAG: FAD-dependent oxidoreductase [Pseudanabaenaceae cyanobacterium]
MGARPGWVLVGGGHSHVVAVRRWLRCGLPGGVQWVTESPVAWYSGTVPAVVAGEQPAVPMDLAALARRAGVELRVARARGLDWERQVVQTDDGEIPFAGVSLNIGLVPSAPVGAVPVKPVGDFLRELVTWDVRPGWVVGVVGGGAAGVELSLALARRFADRGLTLRLWQRGRLLGGHPARDWLLGLLRQRGIVVQEHTAVQDITLAGDRRGVHTNRGDWEVQRVVWAVPGRGAAWVGDSGVAVDARGCVLVRDTLQSVSHPRLFAAGDGATLQTHPQPKAGVVAVRQGVVLAANLGRWSRGQPLQPYRPAKRHLSLLGTADGQALAMWGVWYHCHGGWGVLKRWIDGRFARA